MLIDLKKAIDLIKNNEVVAMPTETVYGLAGRYDSKDAIEKIFLTKERPFFDPLIVHISNLLQLSLLSDEFNELQKVLAKKFWPGPLTMILKKKSDVNPMITSGLEYIGIRMPSHTIALALIEACGPLAAPSANKFKKTSPTKYQHVEVEFNSAIGVIDGGECRVGIESTVIGFNQKEIMIYRPGIISKTDIEKCLKENHLNFDVILKESPVSPGQLKHHYMPNVPLLILKNKSELAGLAKNPKEIVLPDNPVLAARTLYSQMRDLNSLDVDLLYVIKKEIHNQSDWIAIWDRLEKASQKNEI